MKIVYFSSSVTGSGHIIFGLSINNALKRKGIDADYTILTDSKFENLIEHFNVPHISIPPEGEIQLSKKLYQRSELYTNLVNLNPDILIVDLFWFPLHYMINELESKKIFLSMQVNDNFYNIKLRKDNLIFRPEDYDFVFSTEPFKSSFIKEKINPIIIRNKDEILTRTQALEKLGLDCNAKNCLLAVNGQPGEFEEIKQSHAYLEHEGYTMFCSTNYDGGIFPAADYFNAFDLIVCSAGYNSFWEVVYFDKQAVFVPVPRRFESQMQRIEECQDYVIEQNGADQLVDVIMNM